MDTQRNHFQTQAVKIRKYGRDIVACADKMLQHRAAYECQEDVERADKSSEKARVLIRDLILESGVPNAIQITEDITAQNVPVTMGFTEEGWFQLFVPLLPPKKSAGSAKYIRSYLYPAMKNYFVNAGQVRIFSQCVVIFLHRYDHRFPEKEYRDHDNIETNMVVDTLAVFLMEDDGAKRCWHQYYMLPGNVTRTEVYVVPKTEIAAWQEKYLFPYLEEESKS